MSYKIVPIKVTRFELRRGDGKKVKTFSTRAAARHFAMGYMAAVDKGLADMPASKPTKKTRKTA